MVGEQRGLVSNGMKRNVYFATASKRTTVPTVHCQLQICPTYCLITGQSTTKSEPHGTINEKEKYPPQVWTDETDNYSVFWALLGS